jgi:signal transduction histidine kinase
MFDGLRRRQVVLFLLAIVVPSLVLVVMGARLTVQERELASKRAADERARRLDDISQALATYLERLTLTHLAAPRTESLAAPVVLVARIEQDRIVLPWDETGRDGPLPSALPDRAAAAIREGEQEELVDRRPDRAVAHYARAAASSRDPGSRGYARLLRARALVKSGRHAEARTEYAALLTLPSAVTDEHGIPIWAYAAQRLVALAEDQSAEAAARALDTIVRKIESELPHASHLPPAARYLLRDLGTPALRETLTVFAVEADQAVALQAAFPGLATQILPSAPSRPARWAPFGDPQWLVGAVAAADGTATLVAVRAEDALRAATDVGSIAGVRLLKRDATDGERLGDRFPGLRIAYEPPGSDVGAGWQLQRWFAWTIVALVLGVTGSGGYFLWRDMQRERRVAELRSQFVSSVSHELKTPLTAIRMFAETLRMGRASSEETAAEYLDTIVNESERLTRLLNNVLEFSKMERGVTRFRLSPQPVGEPVRSAVRAMSYPLSQQGFTLTVDVPDNLPAVPLDHDAIEQAVLNLLANAMKYSGGAREIELRLSADATDVVIEVTDHGIGIAPHEQARIFERFYRASTDENKHIPGTGLGLTLVDHIARGHGGLVRVQSVPGSGSTFALVLPVTGAGTDQARANRTPLVGARVSPL